VNPDTGFFRTRHPSRRLQNGLDTDGAFDEQAGLNGKKPTCGAFAEPSDGLEPSTPPYDGGFALRLPWAGIALAKLFSLHSRLFRR
jgi:hypothetical protein